MGYVARNQQELTDKEFEIITSGKSDIFTISFVAIVLT